MNLTNPEIDKETAMELWINEHSKYAKEQVILNNVGMVGFVLKRLKLNPLDEDLFSIGLIGLVKAVNTFNQDRGFAFSTYAIPIIRNEILKTFRKKRIVPTFSLDDTCDLENEESVNFADMISDNKRFEEDVIVGLLHEEIMNLLSEKEREVISLRMDGKTQDEVAQILNVSQSQISRIIKESLRKCRKILDME